MFVIYFKGWYSDITVDHIYSSKANSVWLSFNIPKPINIFLLKPTAIIGSELGSLFLNNGSKVSVCLWEIIHGFSMASCLIKLWEHIPSFWIMMQSMLIVSLFHIFLFGKREAGKLLYLVVLNFRLWTFFQHRTKSLIMEKVILELGYKRWESSPGKGFQRISLLNLFHIP